MNYEELKFKFSDILNDETKVHQYVDEFFEHVIKHDISNVYICSNDKIVIDRNKHKVVITDEPLTVDQVKWLVFGITESETSWGLLQEGKSLDRAKDFRFNGRRARFRINIMRVYHIEQEGVQITIRTIDFDPPPLEKIGFTDQDEMYKYFFSEQGLSLITGPTGSGKSTTLASYILNYGMAGNHSIINTYEEPIEYVHDYINKNSKTCRVYQTEVPTGIENFDIALEKSLRRQPEIIMIGELRDSTTISSAIEAGLTGHLVMSTTHTNGVPATIKRLVTKFDANERSGRQIDLIEQLNIIIAQRLLRTVDGGKVAVREYLIFDDEVKVRLQSVDPLLLNVETRKIMQERKNGMVIEAKKLLNKGIIDKGEYDKIAMIYKEEYTQATSKKIKK